jgi:phosphonopyruvate decarboxylase
MLNPKDFFESLQKNGVDFFAGVPDSLLKDFCAYVEDVCPKKNHFITANEGLAVSLATGYHLATKKIPVVYLQNSGLGNLINPLLSLTDPEVYKVPILMVIGWRGEPGVSDEPQHVKQGKVMTKMLESMDLPHTVVGPHSEDFAATISTLTKNMLQTGMSHVLLIKKGTFSPYKLKSAASQFEMEREEAIQFILAKLDRNSRVVSTTGMISREVYETRMKNDQPLDQDFLTVGSMGHCSHIALGLALQTSFRVVCLDGDGSLLMHMGGMPLIGQTKPSNFIHIVLNNGAHDSVGGQPTLALDIDIPQIALSCGYRQAISISKKQELEAALMSLDKDGPSLIEVKVRKGSRADLGRPKSTPIQNKETFMRALWN